MNGAGTDFNSAIHRRLGVTIRWNRVLGEACQASIAKFFRLVEPMLEMGGEMFADA